MRVTPIKIRRLPLMLGGGSSAPLMKEKLDAGEVGEGARRKEAKERKSAGRE